MRVMGLHIRGHVASARGEFAVMRLDASRGCASAGILKLVNMNSARVK